jgi:cell division protein FtsI/penicillin-binding protein 2
MYTPRPTRQRKIEASIKLLHKKFFSHTKWTRELGLIVFFCWLIGIIVLRLFYLEVIKAWYYRTLMSQQHSSKVDITAKRGNIFAYDNAGKPVPLATNADIYTLYVDPKFVWDAQRVTDILTPELYSHLCDINGLETVTPIQCISNIEQFTKTTILPRLKVLYYSNIDQQSGEIALVSWWLLENQVIVDQDNSEIKKQRAEIIASFTRDEALSRIRAQLLSLLSPQPKTKNFLGFFESPALLDALSGAQLAYLSIDNTYYVSITPTTTKDIMKEALRVSEILKAHGYTLSPERIAPLFSPQDTRYVKITDGINAESAQHILKAKDDNYDIQSTCKNKPSSCEKSVPLLHGVGLEKQSKRYYPLGKFASNILGYMTPEWGLYGIEQRYNQLLKGTPGQIRGLSTPWIGAVWSNDVSIINPVDGGDVYLTIDPSLQKNVETLISHYVKEFAADSISILVMDPYSGNIVASANAPTFNPNIPQASYELEPLTLYNSYIVDDETHVDIPVYYLSGEKLSITTYDQRKDPTLKKFVAKNLLWPQVFVDKNIAFPYEPGSIIKPFTVSIGLDNDEISLYDFYNDPKGEIAIDLGDGASQYIRNADKYHCIGTNTFLHALIYSCNIGMVRIAQKVKKNAFFNFMEKIGFGQLTNIELAGEDPGFLDTAANAGLARFFNNAFGQWFLATPIQIAAWYSMLVNGWYYVKPRIVDKIFDNKTQTTINNPIKIGWQVIRKETSDKIKDALFQVIYGWLTKKFGIPWYTLGGKTGTSQISFKGNYRSGNGWTNASFAGMVTKENLKYVVVIQVRRPRTNQFGEYTAGKIFGDVSKLLIEKDLILK